MVSLLYTAECVDCEHEVRTVDKEIRDKWVTIHPLKNNCDPDNMVVGVESA